MPTELPSPMSPTSPAFDEVETVEAKRLWSDQTGWRHFFYWLGDFTEQCFKKVFEGLSKFWHVSQLLVCWWSLCRKFVWFWEELLGQSTFLRVLMCGNYLGSSWRSTVSFLSLTHTHTYILIVYIACCKHRKSLWKNIVYIYGQAPPWST